MSSDASSNAPGLRARFGAFWVRHRTLFWALHSLWALATGVAVLYLARERYGFVPWVVLFLGLTWVSTLVFGRRMSADGEVSGAAPGFGEEATSYLTRTMYQETLFFLLPFYWYSTVVGSINMIFPLLLAGLAVFSCVDLIFDRWLRTSPVFGLFFFAMVAFGALNLLLPILAPIEPAVASAIAAMAAVGSAIPLALHVRPRTPGRHVRVLLAGVVVLVLGVGLPGLVPPVPLRLQNATFSSSIDRDTLVPADTLGPSVGSTDVDRGLFLLVQVFSPSIVPTRVNLEWKRDGESFRTSRDIEITAHDLGFRVWDGWRPDAGPIPTGRYQVVLRAGRGRVFGTAGIEVTAP